MNPIKTRAVPARTTATWQRVIAQIARFVVGVIFIFSGLIKINDPVGTQIKLTEYFEVFALDVPSMAGFFHGLIPYTLILSVFFCAAEVVLGVALLLSYRIRLTSWILLALIVFFTFLTFYSAYFNKVTDCGCFGDAIKLKPWTSFSKDIFLLVLILVIIWQRRVFRNLRTGFLVGLATVASVALGVYAIQHLPPLDLLPYAVGKSIPAQMQPSEPLRFAYVLTKDGKDYEFEKYPTDTTYKFKEMVLMNESAKPKITDYRVWNDEGDFTQATFEGNKLMLIIRDIHDLSIGDMPAIRKLMKGVEDNNVMPMILTSVSDEQINAFRHEYQLAVPVYKADATVLKTIVRSNPGLWLISNGVVRGKWHHTDTPAPETVLSLLPKK
ncbi:putative membrane protein YphA (DoxX/SURF4 family) [Larkinella arboricola]|uniref:Putative membrane protein YphA (DoxX/SURF4 family) n=1 Tax=Larkinella arboricola TaxID=643671 RepID=A0A327WPG9_LARAB|nr:BT_3928 family protein [Larkinella arboricola]RAJ92623.1 putative membrane protein YphA (DoxX/SURF4 family) [Larkinella arboricola]